MLQLGARPDGAGVTLFVNPASHSGAGAKVIRAARAHLPALRVVELRPGEDWDALIRQRGAAADVLAVAGGVWERREDILRALTPQEREAMAGADAPWR